ncbi:unnamed protein product [Peronospora destructor]|uniref:Uncharacterized protein n=1 Tax=Peronospora destructor TaxID=86335 RepID=A0AAV0V3D0_9STRA|nr:unnamed protein product [Peronospora destructor]
MGTLVNLHPTLATIAKRRSYLRNSGWKTLSIVGTCATLSDLPAFFLSRIGSVFCQLPDSASYLSIQYQWAARNPRPTKWLLRTRWKLETEATPAETDAVPAEIKAAPAETEPVSLEQVDVNETAVNELTPSAEERRRRQRSRRLKPPRSRSSPRSFTRSRATRLTRTGVVFYIVETVEGDIVSRVYQEALPDSGLGTKLRGKHNLVVIKKRETQLAIVLDAIANGVELAETEAFTSFAQ